MQIDLLFVYLNMQSLDPLSSRDALVESLYICHGVDWIIVLTNTQAKVQPTWQSAGLMGIKIWTI